MQGEVPEGRNTNARTVELVKLIGEIGPDIPEIARRLGQFKESVRYRYKEKVLAKGFGIQASIEHEKLGLRRVVLFADFSPPFKQYANSILSAMNELCYVVGFEKRMFRGDYYVEASVPTESVVSFVSLMMKLKEKGLFSSLEVYPFDLFRNVQMRAESYDFDTGRWDYDWSNPIQPQVGVDYRPPDVIKFDDIDLLILKELQMDASRSFVEIAKKLKVNYKMLAWHYKTHVIQRGMLSGYYLRWMGTTYSTVLERALHRKHRYQHLALLARDLSDLQRMSLMGRVHEVPFLWNELVGPNTYLAHFYFPNENITEAYQFLTSAIAEIKDNAMVMPLDQTEALAFTISYPLYEGKGKWKFSEAELVLRFDTLIQKIEEIGGSQ